MAYVKIKGDDKFIKDPANQAILSCDNSGLASYKRKREQQKKLNEQSGDINNMKQDINDLKTLMQRILDKIG
jgi:hypothetical protein